MLLPFVSRRTSFQPDASLLQGLQSFTGPHVRALSARELECGLWVALGKTRTEVSMILQIHERTVNHHLQSLTEKLGVCNMHAAVARLYQLGYVDAVLRANPP